MRIEVTVPIRKLAVEIPGAIPVFESFGLDYACAGDRALEEVACAEGIDPALVVASLQRLRAVSFARSWSERPIGELTRYLRAQHHRIVRDELATIALRLADVCSCPPGVPPGMTELRAAFTELADVVLPHMHHEEENVFPRVEALENVWQSTEPLAGQPDLAVHIAQLTVEHGQIAAQLRVMRELRLRLALAEDLPPRGRSILDGVAMLEGHLHEYMFLENSILFPRAVAMEQQAAAVAYDSA